MAFWRAWTWTRILEKATSWFTERSRKYWTRSRPLGGYSSISDHATTTTTRTNLQRLFRFMRTDYDSLDPPPRSVISATEDLVISNLESAERMERVFSFTVTTTAN